MLLAATLEGAGMKFRAIVDVDDVRQAKRRPGKIDRPVREPRRLGQHRLRQRQRGPGRARRIQRQREAGDHAGMHIKHERQPGAANTGPRHVVHQHDVDLGMVDLYHLQRPLRPQPGLHLPEAVRGDGGTFAGLRPLAQTSRRHTGPERLHGWWFDPGGDAIPMHFAEQPLDGGPLGFEVDRIDCCINLRLNLRIKPAAAFDPPPFERKQRGRQRAAAKILNKAVGPGNAQAQTFGRRLNGGLAASSRL